MSRTTLILITILAIVAIGGGAYLWLNKDSLSNPLSTTNTTTNSTTTANTNTSTANLNLSTADTLKGDKTLDTKLTVGGADIQVTSSLKAATYESVAAPAGKEFLVIYFEGISGDKVSVVDAALASGAHLLVGTTTVALTGIKVATNVVKNDRGYLKFIVPIGASNVNLEVGTGVSAQRVKLAY